MRGWSEDAALTGEAELALAYEMALASLPRREEWFGTISKRCDGSSADGIFSALEALRAEFYSRLGERIVLASACLSVLGSDVADNADVVSAYELAAMSIPRRDEWYAAVAARSDGVNAEEIFQVLGRLRAEIHEAIGDRVARAAFLERVGPI